MTNFESELVNLHAIAERKRNTKGLIGYGCLTFYFAGCVLLSFVYLVVAIFPSLWDLGGSNPSQAHQELPDVSSSLAAIVVFGGIGYFPFRAMRKRLRCRRYYAAIVATAPQEVPPAAPDLSKRQQEKEHERFTLLEEQLRLGRLISGEIEAAQIEALPDEIRAQHVGIPGLPGYGKSTLMHWMAMQDIANGKGLTIIDPAGDLVGNGLPDNPDFHVEGIIDWIPYDRIKDTIYLDLKQPIPIDFLSYADEDEKQTVATNLVELFTRLSEMFGGQPGVRFGGILRDIIYTLFEAGDTSFIDIYDFIKDPARRTAILACVSPLTRAQWDRFPNDEKTEPIISRLTPIAKNPRLRTIFGTPNAKLKISEVMDGKNILLVNIGGAPEAGVILGTMIISQILQAALRRAEMPKHRRVPHYIYVDEFQNFQTGSDFAKILTQCRKFNLCLTIANQYTAQLPSSVFSAVLGGTSTWFLFRMSPQDIPLFRSNLPSVAYAPIIEKRHPHEAYPEFLRDNDEKPVDTVVGLKPLPFDPHIIAQLQVGEAIHRKADATAEKVMTFPLGKRPVASFANLIRNRTIEQYAVAPSQTPSEPNTLGHEAKPEDIASEKRKDLSRQPNKGKAPRTSR